MVKLSDGGINDWSNMQALCSECYSRSKKVERKVIKQGKSVHFRGIIKVKQNHIHERRNAFHVKNYSRESGIAKAGLLRPIKFRQ